MNSFHYAMSLAEQIYGIQLKEDTWEEIALVGWNLIGNKRYRIYKYTASTTPIGDCEHAIELPCNADVLEAVTSSIEEFQETSNIDTYNRSSFIIEQYIENFKHRTDPLYSHGRYLKYQIVGNNLIFTRPHYKVNILYKGILLDEDGLPELTDKEALAIATYTAYITKFKEGILTNNRNIIEIANTLKSQWLTQCDQARTDQYLNQNDWDEILDAKVNYDRKQFHKSFKIFHG